MTEGSVEQIKSDAHHQCCVFHTGFLNFRDGM